MPAVIRYHTQHKLHEGSNAVNLYRMMVRLSLASAAASALFAHSSES